MIREEMLTRTMVELADNLVDDFDIVELLTTLSDRCVDVLDVAASGIMLLASDGELTLMTSSSEVMRVVEMFELQAQEGPCLDCYRSGKPVFDGDLTNARDRWPRFSAVAIGAGFKAAGAVPMRLRSKVVGALNLFRTEAGALNEADVLVAQALADIATIAIVQHKTVTEAQVLNDQLNTALQSRIVIEQSKGMVAEREGVNMERAFSRLRAHARNHNMRLATVAADVVQGRLDPAALDPEPPA